MVTHVDTMEGVYKIHYSWVVLSFVVWASKPLGAQFLDFRPRNLVGDPTITKGGM